MCPRIGVHRSCGEFPTGSACPRDFVPSTNRNQNHRYAKVHSNASTAKRDYCSYDFGHYGFKCDHDRVSHDHQTDDRDDFPTSDDWWGFHQPRSEHRDGFRVGYIGILSLRLGPGPQVKVIESSRRLERAETTGP